MLKELHNYNCCGPYYWNGSKSQNKETKICPSVLAKEDDASGSCQPKIRKHPLYWVQSLEFINDWERVRLIWIKMVSSYEKKPDKALMI